MRSRLLLVALLLASAGVAKGSPAPPAAGAPAAIVERFEIRARGGAFGGVAFPGVGAYERIDALARVSVDPAHAMNRAIVDLALAPRDAQGRVAYDTDVVILRPKDPARANRALLYEVVNRGGRLALGVLNDAARGGDLAEAAGAGNGFLFRRGYTLVWVGWQADVAGPGLMSARFPVASENGAPITGRVQVEQVFDHAENPAKLALPYAAASLDPEHASLSVRQRQGDAPQALPASALRFPDERTAEIARPAGMDAGAIYELVYTARDPVVAGLGFAATRDVISFLRYEARDASGGANPLAGAIDRALAIGFSQSGRYLRDWSWQGFHVDGAGRPVFDGVLPFIAGARKTWTNARFAQPGRFSRQHEDHRVPGNQFPFTYAVTKDPVTGATDGILGRCEQTKTCPKLMHVDTSAEFWQAGASLVGTDGAGHDLAFPENVRAYLIAGASHFPGYAAPYCELAANPLTHGPVARALLVAMDLWVKEDETPPNTRWPSIDKGTLVPPAKPLPNPVERIDYSRVPPMIDARPGWRVLVPKTDADGNDVAGVPLYMLEEKRGAYLGWNVRKPGFAGGELCFIFGSFVPSTRKAEPGEEPSVHQRAFVTQQLYEMGFLLSEDVLLRFDRALEGTGFKRQQGR